MGDQERDSAMTDLGYNRGNTFQNSPPKYPLRARRGLTISSRASPPSGKVRIHLISEPADQDRVYRADIAADLVARGKAHYV